MYGQPRKTFYMIVENRPEMMKTIIHENFMDGENDLDAHREAKKYIEQHHNKHLRLLKCQTIGEYAYNSVLYPEDYELQEGIELENPDPQ